MTVWYLLLALLLLVANGFFVGAEFALIAARRSKIEAMAEHGGRRATAAVKSLRELSLMLAGAQLGITMASLGLGAIAEPAVGHLIESAISGIELSETASHSIAFVLSMSIVVFLHMVLGEMAPKNIAIALPEKSLLWFIMPFRAYTTVFRPFIHLLNMIANAGVRVMGVEPLDELKVAHSQEEISAMISESAGKGMLRGIEHRLLAGAAGFGERDAASVMIPRTEMVAAPSTATAADIETLMLESGLSRFPIFKDDIDHVLGFFHVKDLLKVKPAERRKPLPRRFVRDMLVAPETRKLPALLIDMKRERQHFSLVVDEHGGTSGIVTLEDILEELVGDINDEYDLLASGIQKLAEDRFLLPGSLPVHEAADVLGLELPEGGYETVAGFLMEKLGRIPRRRDAVDHDGWRLRVLTMHRRRVVQVIAERVAGTVSAGRSKES
ncbi:MAG TPA: hemolysin family protein [Actinomycetota bacterium]|nr:hemolysin family protein [Actinomycetota bacterium]